MGSICIFPGNCFQEIISLKSRGVELHFVNSRYIVELSDLSIRLRIPFPTERSIKKIKSFCRLH